MDFSIVRADIIFGMQSAMSSSCLDEQGILYKCENSVALFIYCDSSDWS